MPHIPDKRTQDIEVEPFETALAAALAHGPDDLFGSWLYVPGTYREYRYILGTRGAKPLVCIGVNPSTAEPRALDNTLRSVSRIAAANGFDSWIMFNVYAQRATRPDDMDEVRDERLHRENVAAFRWLLSRAGAAPAVWAAWGAVIEKRAYLSGCVRDLVAVGESFAARWMRAGAVSKAGHPHHPLYLRKDEPLRAFDVKAYLERMKTPPAAPTARGVRAFR